MALSLAESILNAPRRCRTGGALRIRRTTYCGPRGRRRAPESVPALAFSLRGPAETDDLGGTGSACETTMRILTRRAFLGTGLAAAGASAAFVAQRRSEHLESLLFHRWLSRMRPDVRTVRLAAVDPDIEWDACIVGSGPVGGTVAARLVERGWRVLVIESGASWSSPSGGTSGDLDRYRVTGELSYPLGGTRLRALGGTSQLWTGRSARLHPSDFEPHAMTPSGAPWPLGYAELQPYYERAERTLRVDGGATSPFRAPRRRPLGDIPVRSELKPLLERIGLSAEPAPTSRSRWADGPWKAHVDALPDLTRSANATVVTQATATRIVSGGRDGQIGVLHVRDLDGTSRDVRAACYVLACGGVESARLLLLSRSPTFPDGVGNDAGQVGRSFMEHPHLELTASIPYRLDSRWGASATSHQFYDSMKAEGLGSMDLTAYLKPGEEENFVLRAVVEQAPSPDNRILLADDNPDAFGDPGADLALGLTPLDEATRTRAREIFEELFERAGATAIRESPLSWGHHHIGSTRMGDDPETAVVDSSLRVYGTRNLYVVGSSIFVTSGGGHPTLLAVAFAHRLADHLTRHV